MDDGRPRKPDPNRTTNPLRPDAGAGLTTPLERGVAVWASSPREIYQVASLGVIVRSEDGGERWTLLQSGTRADLCGVWGRAGEVLFVVGEGGLVQSSRDGGWSFGAHPSGTSERLLAIAGRGPRLLAVGAHGTLVASEDDGMTFAPRASSTFAHLHACALLDGGGAVAVGEEGTVVRSNDGVHFRAVPVPTGEHLFGLRADGERVLVVGSAGTVLVSRDGARSFEHMPRTTSETLRAAWSHGPTLLGVGRGGAAVCSDDDGATWCCELISRTGDFSDLCELGTRDLLLVGPRGMVLRIDW